MPSASLLPIVAAFFAVPQFLPQLASIRRTGDTSGVSLTWMMLTAANNTAWICYFAASDLWLAIVPNVSVVALSSAVSVSVARVAPPTIRTFQVLAAWLAFLAGAWFVGRADALGALLAIAFVVQAAPSLITAYTVKRPTGLSATTWALIAGELVCWTTFGIVEDQPALISLGITGLTASALMLGRIAGVRQPFVIARPATSDLGRRNTTAARTSRRRLRVEFRHRRNRC